MTTYMIGYDLQGASSEEYEDLIEAIKSLSGSRWHYLDSTWIISSESKASEIRENLKPHLNKGDRLLVIKVSTPWASFGLSDKQNDWLKNHVE